MTKPEGSTTVEVPIELLWRAKAAAIAERMTLKAWISKVIEAALAAKEAAKP